MLDGPSVEVLSSGLARDWLQFFTWLVVCLGLSYYRVYVDGAAAQPLAVLVGGVGKLGIVAMLAAWHAGRGRAKAGIALGYVPDLALGLYFVKVWWVDLAGKTTAGSSLVAQRSASEAKKK
jgi:hypothetical protein